MDGIYIAYVSGSEGYSAILFVLRNGNLTGADIGGVKYRGRYNATETAISGTLIVSYPANSATITGFNTGPSPAPIQIPFEIKMENIGRGYITLNTPVGPVTAAIEQVQELP
jgi:hypothetical protein